jgi:hypothetical protein
MRDEARQSELGRMDALLLRYEIMMAPLVN